MSRWTQVSCISFSSLQNDDKKPAPRTSQTLLSSKINDDDDDGESRRSKWLCCWLLLCVQADRRVHIIIIIELCVLRLFTLHDRPTQTILCCFWGCIQSDHCVWWNRKGTEYKNHKIRTLLLKLQPWITLSWHMFLRNPRILIDWNNSRMIKTKMDSPSSTFYTSSRRLAAQFLKSMNIQMDMCINY